MTYPQVAPSIDLTFEPRLHGVEYSLRAAPGTDPGALRFRYEGALEVIVAPDGSAVDVVTGLGVLRETGLVVLQEGRALAARYVARGPLEYSIEVDARDPRLPLLIDPLIGWTTYLGGNLDPTRDSSDNATCIAADAAGNVYVGGQANSMDFPLVGAFDRYNDYWGEGFITKISPAGAIVWSTFIGGNDETDRVHAIAVDGVGDVYVTGMTNASTFPILGGLGAPYNGTTAFVAKLSSAGALVWSSYLGGNNVDYGHAIAVDGSGNVYVAGETRSPNFPIVGGFDSLLATGTTDAFVVKINAAGTAIVWSSYLGGSGDDFAYGIAVDGAGNVFVTGKTTSTDFPASGGFDAAISGSADAFVTKIAADGASIMWSSYLGGSQSETGRAIATDGSGNIFVAGETDSSNFPASGGFDVTHNGGTDGFVVKIADGSPPSVTWASFLGGTFGDVARAIVVRGTSVYVAGETFSSDFPSTNGFDTTSNGFSDAFVTKINDSTAPPTITWSSFLGGNGYSVAYGIAVDASGYVFLAGETQASNFPTTGGFDTTLGGFKDAFVTKVNGALAMPTLTWSSYLGGAAGPGVADAASLAVDSFSNVIVTGYTQSVDFPVTPGAADLVAVNNEIYVAKFNSSGTLLWATYLGGSLYESAGPVAVDALGNIYVAGVTSSTDFPIVGGFDGTPNGMNDLFVAKLPPTGSSLTWSTLLGGDKDDYVNTIAVDGSGNVYVGGSTMSTNFPTTNGFNTTRSGSFDGFVTKIAASGASILWSTLVGGSADDMVWGLAVDSTGNVYVTGTTSSADFPVPGGFDMTLGGALDAFVMKINSAGGANPTIGWSTYLGGSSDDTGKALALSGGFLVVGGLTASVDFPTSGGFDTTHGGGTYDGWVAKIDVAGPTLTWGTYLGGSGSDQIEGVAVDGAGDIYVTGYGTSTDFPTLDAFDSTSNGSYDAFVAKIKSDGTAILWSSYLGGSGLDYGHAIAVDLFGNAYVAGDTRSLDFPVVSAFDAVFNGAETAFVTKVASGTVPPPGGGGGGCGLLGLEVLVLTALARYRRRA
jgi:hypothetical protein